MDLAHVAQLAEHQLRTGKPDNADALLSELARVNPDDPWTLRTLAFCRLDQGRTGEAVALLARCQDVAPAPETASELAFYSLHVGRPWAPWRHPTVPPPGRTWDGARRLRVGYLSPNLRRHTVAKFLEPVLAGHTDAVEVFAYCDNAHDAVTDRLRAHVGHWRDVVDRTDDGLYEAIAGDRLDVLVDLTGHLNAGRRQAVLWRNPAPVTVGYIGWPAATGQPGVYRIGDAVTDPEGPGEGIVRLPGCAWAYRPDDDAPPVAVRGAGGGVVFGSLNRVCKVTPGMAALWRRILDAVAGSRLLVLAPGGEGNTSARGLFGGDERVRLVPTGPGYLDVIDTVDVALDTSPYSGMTTTCDCLWQGVPVVTLAGGAHVGRASASLLTAVGLGDLVATTAEAYVAGAVALARDHGRRAELRGSLRDTMGRTLCDGGRVARAMEAAFYTVVGRVATRPLGRSPFPEQGSVV